MKLVGERKFDITCHICDQFAQFGLDRREKVSFAADKSAKECSGSLISSGAISTDNLRQVLDFMNRFALQHAFGAEHQIQAATLSCGERLVHGIGSSRRYRAAQD